MKSHIHGVQEHPRFECCYPGDDIPKWFNYQTLGSSMNINLPADWCSTKFMGFCLCFVLGSTINIDPDKRLDILYDFNFKRIKTIDDDDDCLYKYSKVCWIVKRSVQIMCWLYMVVHCQGKCWKKHLDQIGALYQVMLPRPLSMSGFRCMIMVIQNQ